MRFRRNKAVPASGGPELTSLVACFLRVDIELDGEHSTQRYNELAEQLQNQLQELWLTRGDETGVVVQQMVCTTLGPLLRADSMAEVDEVEAFEEHWRPIAEWRDHQ